MKWLEKHNSNIFFIWWTKTSLIYPLKRNVSTHEELFLLDSTDERKRLEQRRTRFEHETFFILSAFYTWHRLFVTRQTLTRLNWWKRAGFICTAINFGNTCNDNAENANIYEERKNIQREREKERRERFCVWFKHWKWNDFIRLALITFVYFVYMNICARFALAHDWLSFDFSYSRLHLSVWISFGEMYTRDGLFVMFQTLSRTPFQSDNAMAVVGTRHNNLVTPVSLTPSHIPYMLSISHIQPCWCDVQMALFVWVVETTKLYREREREREWEAWGRE